jgi:hypothetical protein
MYVWYVYIYIYIYIYIYNMCIHTIFSLSIYQVLGTSADCSLAIVNTTSINMGVQESLLCIDLHSFGRMPKSVMVGSSGLFLVF